MKNFTITVKNQNGTYGVLHIVDCERYVDAAAVAVNNNFAPTTKKDVPAFEMELKF